MFSFITHLIHIDPDMDRKPGLKWEKHFGDTDEQMDSLCKNSSEYVSLFMYFFLYIFLIYALCVHVSHWEYWPR